MLVKIFINDKYYKTVETGPNDTVRYDPSHVTRIIDQDKQLGLLNQFGINEQCVISIQPVNS